VAHGIIYEPDLECRRVLQAALASLYWSVRLADSLDHVAGFLPGPWACVVAIESGDLAALETVRGLRSASPELAICALVDEASPDFDRQLAEAGADTVFAKPVHESEIVEALVAGFMARRGQAPDSAGKPG
jgi:DNA-binding response OmpR family regulator